MSQKKWGSEDFWGLGFEYDPQWLLTDEQKKIQALIIDLAQKEMRENAIESDKKLLFPRKNFQILAKHGLLGLLVPKSLGGLGQNHVCAAMVVETIARYACPSTAMCYTMHTGAVAAALFRHHDNPVLQDIMRRIDKDCLVGTLPLRSWTGLHFWYPISRAREGRGRYKCAKRRPDHHGGFADWYVLQTTSPISAQPR
jgi:hypothetical protein